MLVCGPDHLIYYASTRWPGSVNDSRVFRESALRELLETGQCTFISVNTYEMSSYKCLILI